MSEEQIEARNRSRVEGYVVEESAGKVHELPAEMVDTGATRFPPFSYDRTFELDARETTMVIRIGQEVITA